MRFLLTRRWMLFLGIVALLAYLAWWLGEWQFHRLEDRKDRNEHASANLTMDPVPVDQVLSAQTPVSKSAEWSRVEVTGEFQPEDTVIVRYRTRDGAAGVNIVTPVRLAGGAGVLVDRGWMATDNVGNALQAAPEPVSGPVTVVGWVRGDGTGSSTHVEDHGVRAISSRSIGETVGYPLLQGFVEAESQTPPATDDLIATPPPDLGEGPHFFYGLQWWFFGLLAIFGFGYLAYDEARKAKRKHQREALPAESPTDS